MGQSAGTLHPFLHRGLRLDFQRIAFANVAWCGTAKNIYPHSMLARCFARHTGPLLQLLRPHVVLACGRQTHAFAPAIRALVPTTQVIEALHYAHREGHTAEQRELKRLRTAMAIAKRTVVLKRGSLSRPTDPSVLIVVTFSKPT